VFHCVEPVPEFFAVLSENAASYGAPNVKLYNRAVSGTQGELVRIHTQLGTAGAVAEYDNHTPFGVVESVASTVDAMFEGLPVGLLKIDTDGFEPSVLAGAKETIRRCRPLLFMEFHPALLRKAGSDPRAVVGLLRQFGYEEVTIWTNQGDLVERAASLDMLLGHAEAALHYVDVLLRPKAISST
jgi:FkbM family methyltransferase